MKGRVESVPTWHCSHTLQDLFNTRPSKKQPILPRIDFRPSESDLQQDVYGSSLPEAAIIDRMVLGSEARDLAQASGCACLAKQYTKNLRPQTLSPPSAAKSWGAVLQMSLKRKLKEAPRMGLSMEACPIPQVVQSSSFVS